MFFVFVSGDVYEQSPMKHVVGWTANTTINSNDNIYPWLVVRDDHRRVRSYFEYEFIVRFALGGPFRVRRLSLGGRYNWLTFSPVAQVSTGIIP